MVGENMGKEGKPPTLDLGLTCNQEFYYLGLNNTSATFASATENSIPAISFLMAALFGQEKSSIFLSLPKSKIFSEIGH
ncbi:wat1-related protein [Quercus suber]|uniref:Wat1-related protein n=1 Tax=Quercus suber TaxID=58331 RepID=A0AAW0L3D3_QUESU